MHEVATTEPKEIPIHMTIDPNSAEWWSRWSDWLKIAGFALGLLVTVIAVVGWAFSLKAGKLKDEASKLKEAALERYKQESKQSIAESDAKAAEANKIAAQANERTALLEKEAGIARLELEKLKTRQADRFLTRAENDLLVSRVKSRKGGAVCIVSIMGDLEAIRYANQFKSAFDAAGWNVSGVEQKGDPTGMSFGIIVCVRDLASPPPHALFVRNELVSMGFNVGYSANKEVLDDLPWLVVGSKQATILPSSK